MDIINRCVIERTVSSSLAAGFVLTSGNEISLFPAASR